MAESDEFEFSLDLEDCLKDNMPMLCLEIPQTYDGFMIQRDTLNKKVEEIFSQFTEPCG